MAGFASLMQGFPDMLQMVQGLPVPRDFVTLISKALEMWDALWMNGIRQALKISAETLSWTDVQPPPPDEPTNPEPSGT